MRSYTDNSYVFALNTSSITNATYFLQERQKINTQIIMDKISFIKEDKDLFAIVLEKSKNKLEILQKKITPIMKIHYNTFV